MIEPLPIKVGVDGTPTSESAIRFAARRARQLGRRLTLVHVVPWWEFGRTHVPHKVADVGHRALRDSIAVARQEYSPYLISSELRFGGVVQNLLAASSGAAELILGTDGPATQFVGGSVLSGVAAGARVPIVAVPPATPTHAGSDSCIVAAIDHVDEAFVTAAFAAATESGRPLNFVHVHHIPRHYADIFRSLSEYPAWQWNAEKLLRERIEAIGSDVAGTTFDVTVRWGDPAEVLLDMSQHASLMLIEREPHRRRAFGETGTALLRASHCPVQVPYGHKTAMLTESAADRAALGEPA